MRWLLALFLGLGVHAQAAVTYTNSAGPAGGSAPLFTINGYTTGSGTNRAMLVGVMINTNGKMVLSVSYGGYGFSLLTKSAGVTNNNVSCEFWWATGIPASLPGNVSVTTEAGTGGDASVIEYEGADQTAPFSNFGIAGGDGSANPISVSITTAATNSVLVNSLIYFWFLGTATAPPGYTARHNTASTYVWFYDKTAGAPGIYNAQWSQSANTWPNNFLAEVKAFVNPVTATQPLSPYHSNDLLPRMAPITRP